MFLDTGGDAHQAASGAPASLGVPPMRNDALIGISCNRLTGLYPRTDTEIVGHDEPAMDLQRSLAAVGVRWKFWNFVSGNRIITWLIRPF
jgi:hypothetical protein